LNAAINDPKNVMEACWFICNKFQLAGTSPFFEGDSELMDYINLHISSFFRYNSLVDSIN